MQKQLTIEQARDKIAGLIAKGEKQYLPIFIRLDKEYQKQQEQDTYLKKALYLHKSPCKALQPSIHSEFNRQ